jgi:hypothetical protein
MDTTIHTTNNAYTVIRQSIHATSKKNDMEKRKYERFSVAYNAGFCSRTEEMLLPCRIVNISRGGSRIELFAKHELTAGSTIELYIEISGLKRRIVTSFRCMWIHPAEDAGTEGGNVIGGCFIGLSPEDRKILLSHAHEKAA